MVCSIKKEYKSRVRIKSEDEGKFHGLCPVLYIVKN